MSNTHIDEQLLTAATHGRLDDLKAALSTGADINAHDVDGSTALHLAASRGHTGCVIQLIEENADVNRCDKDGWTPLHCAASNDMRDCLVVLLSNGADIAAQDHNGKTALHHTAYSPHCKCLMELLDKTTNINAKNSAGLTALALFVASCRAQHLAPLLRYGADTTGVEEGKLAPVFADMAYNVRETFGNKPIFYELCFTDDSPPRANNAVLDTLATGLFEEIIARRLLAQGPKGKALLGEIIQALPERVKSLHSSMLESCIQQLQPDRTFAKRTAPEGIRSRSL